MKANHNGKVNHCTSRYVVPNISKSKNESKSQPLSPLYISIFVVPNISKSKNESKSQR